MLFFLRFVFIILFVCEDLFSQTVKILKLLFFVACIALHPVCFTSLQVFLFWPHVLLPDIQMIMYALCFVGCCFLFGI